MVSMTTHGTQMTPFALPNPHTALPPLSAAALAEAEAAHAAQGLRIQQAREAQALFAAEIARLEAEAARKETEALREMQAKLQTQLQELAAEEAASVQAFALRREMLAQESKAVAEKLKQLQSSGPRQRSAISGGFSKDHTSLPPHLTSFSATLGTTPASGQLLHGRAEPETPASGPAEPFNLVMGLTSPLTAAPTCGLPRPREALPE